MKEKTVKNEPPANCQGSRNAYVRCVLLVLAFFPVQAALHAQESDVAMSMATLADKPAISVSNSRGMPIEAFLVTVDTAETGRPLSRIYYDVYLNYKHDVPIPPGASKQVPLPHIVGQALPVPTLRAVVFSDGTSIGDGAWIQELLHMRRIVSERLEETMAVLQNASYQHLNREETLNLLQKAWKARREATSDATPDERIRHDQVFYTAMRNLEERHSNLKSPDFSLVLEHVNEVLGLWHSELQAANPPIRPKLRPLPREPRKE